MTNEANTFPLIRTKFNKPCMVDELIPRPRLLEQLQAGLGKKLTLISAPAGFGKTTLACMWLEQCSRPAVWLSLDEEDGNISRFLSYLVASIQTVFPDTCSETNDLLQLFTLPSVDSIATALINDIATLPVNSPAQGFILALDDYHRIDDQTVHQVLSRLIEYQPQQLHLMLINRQDPTSLPLPKLRARGEMLEIRSGDLRFKPDETKAFLLQALGVSLPDETIAALDKWLEGWVVGLRLASLSMRDLEDPTTFVRNLKGTDRFIMEYLVDEVLSHQPDAIQTFMLRTSILNRFCGPLCEAVTGVDDPVCNGQAYLEWLEKTNLFLVSLDHQREWYRFHHLFQDLLISKLEAEYTAAEITELHQRANRWFADHNYIEEAIHHALAANDVETAVKLVENNSRNLLNRTERPALQRWLSLLPEGTLWRRPKLLVPQAWLLYRQWRLTTLESVLDKAEVSLKSGKNDMLSQEYQGLNGHINTLRSATAYLVHHDFQRSLDSARLALQQLSVSEFGARGTAKIYLAQTYQAVGQGEKGIADLEEIINDPAQPALFKIQPFIGLVFIYFKAGEYQRAHQIIRQFLTFAAEINIVTADMASNWLAGLLFYEWNDLSAAVHHFSEAETLLYRGNFFAPFNSILGLAQIYQIQDDPGRAEEMINKARTETLRLQNQELLPLLDAFDAYQALCRNDKLTAMRWVHSLQPAEIHDADFVFDTPSLIRARIVVAYGTDDEVQKTIHNLQDRLATAENCYFTRRVIQILVQLALAHQRLGQSDAAFKLLERAVKLAQPGGAIRSFVDCGPGLVSMLRQLQRKEESSGYISQLLAAFPPASPTQSAGANVSRPGDSDLLDLLTQRETEVLHLMQDGLTNQEIANELVISLYTVKRHATNIYNKLAVNNRRQAIRKAQILGLSSSN